MKRVKLFLKGLCMGVADIIPGVSGGTLALILGIYAELVNTIKGLHLRWLPLLWRWVRHGFAAEDREKLVAQWESMNLSFVVVLGAGIAVAIVAGGLVIPDLLDAYPEVMRALFFGLIVASLGIPLRMVTFRGPSTWTVVALAALVGAAIGWIGTAPDRMHEVGVSWAEVEAQPGETLKEISRRGPSAWPVHHTYWAPENEALRQVLAEEGVAQGLDAADGELEASDPDADGLAERYEALEIPAGTPVKLPQPAPWYIFVVGFVAICAMILPGISGSYLLLVFGAYYFVLNALKAVITGLAALTIPGTAASFVLIFMAGAALGILSFARLMSFLLRRYPAPTLGLLVGLMVGCLRGIWPFQQMQDGRVTNILPPAITAEELAVLAAAIVGALVVTILSRLGRRQGDEEGLDGATP